MAVMKINCGRKWLQFNLIIELPAHQENQFTVKIAGDIYFQLMRHHKPTGFPIMNSMSRMKLSMP